MARELYQDILDAIEQNSLSPYIAVQMNLDSGTVRIWSGNWTKNINGSNFIGVGSLLGISSIEETSELAAAGATVSLSGVPSDLISLALSEPYQGRKALIYFGVLSNPIGWVLADGVWSDNGNWLDTAYWQDSGNQASQIFSGFLDQMIIDEQPELSTIAVTIENKMIDLERVRVYNYSSATQKAIYPSDLGFDFVDSLQEKTYNWGRV